MPRATVAFAVLPPPDFSCRCEGGSCSLRSGEDASFLGEAALKSRPTTQLNPGSAHPLSSETLPRRSRPVDMRTLCRRRDASSGLRKIPKFAHVIENTHLSYLALSTRHLGWGDNSAAGGGNILGARQLAIQNEAGAKSASPIGGLCDAIVLEWAKKKSRSLCCGFFVCSLFIRQGIVPQPTKGSVVAYQCFASSSSDRLRQSRRDPTVCGERLALAHLAEAPV